MIKGIIKDKYFYRTIITIAVPIAIQNLIGSLLNMIDTFMISSVSEAAIGGVGAANKIFFLFNLLLFGTFSGSAILSSQYWGNKDIVNIRRVLGLCLIIGLSVGGVFGLSAILLPEEIMRIFTPDEAAVIEEGSKYLKIIGLSYIFTAVTFAFGYIARTTHHVKLPTIIGSISILINTVLNYGLIFGNLGLPELGVEGAAIATVIARVFETIALVSCMYIFKYPSAGRLRELFDLSLPFVKRFFLTVYPVVINETLWSMGVTVYSMVYGRMGETVIASMTINSTIEQLAFVIMFGISNAGAIMLGNALGADEKEKAKLYAKRFIVIMFSLGTLTGAVMALLSGPISGIFEVSSTVRRNIRDCLIVFSLFVPLKGLNMLSIVGILRSGGDTVAAMVYDLLSVWLVGIPLAILGGLVLKLDIQAVYVLILMEEVAKVVLSYIRVSKKKWLNNLIAT